MLQGCATMACRLRQTGDSYCIPFCVLLISGELVSSIHSRTGAGARWWVSLRAKKHFTLADLLQQSSTKRPT